MFKSDAIFPAIKNTIEDRETVIPKKDGTSSLWVNNIWYWDLPLNEKVLKSVSQLTAKQPTAGWQSDVKSIEINGSLSTDFIGVWIKSFRRISYSAISIITDRFVLVIRCWERAEWLFKALIIHPWRPTFRARVGQTQRGAAGSHWRLPAFPAPPPPGRQNRQRREKAEVGAELVEMSWVPGQISLAPALPLAPLFFPCTITHTKYFQGKSGEPAGRGSTQSTSVQPRAFCTVHWAS